MYSRQSIMPHLHYTVKIAMWCQKFVGNLNDQVEDVENNLRNQDKDKNDTHNNFNSKLVITQLHYDPDEERASSGTALITTCSSSGSSDMVGKYAEFESEHLYFLGKNMAKTDLLQLFQVGQILQGHVVGVRGSKKVFHLVKASISSECMNLNVDQLINHKMHELLLQRNCTFDRFDKIEKVSVEEKVVDENGVFLTAHVCYYEVQADGQDLAVVYARVVSGELQDKVVTFTKLDCQVFGHSLNQNQGQNSLLFPLIRPGDTVYLKNECCSSSSGSNGEVVLCSKVFIGKLVDVTYGSESLTLKQVNEFLFWLDSHEIYNYSNLLDMIDGNVDRTMWKALPYPHSEGQGTVDHLIRSKDNCNNKALAMVIKAESIESGLIASSSMIKYVYRNTAFNL